MRSRVIAAAAALGLIAGVLTSAGAAQAAVPLAAADFIKANGNVLKTGSGSGATINLRGTNLGGWLTQEDWMSPLGEFAADRTGWTATASAGSAGSVLDGSGSSRWSTGANQTGTEWLRIDMGANTLLNRVSFDNTGAGGQYPRTVRVELSQDGTNWTNVAQLSGTDGVTTATFAPQVARYVRVSQLGSAGAQWSVGEFNAFNDPVLHNGTHTATASASAAGSNPASVLDGNLGTVWQTGASQAPGQSLTIDLGRNVDMDKVLFDSGASAPDDYPRIYDAFVSTDNVNWTQVASGYGNNRVTIADFQGAKTGRYLRLVSNGTAGNWWSVAEVAISSGGALDRGGWTITSSVAGSATSALKDNNLSTRWTSGAGQTNGQSITVDMGARITLNNITTDTAKNTNDENDWPRGYKVELSKDGSSWVQVASGVGNFKATTIGFLAQSARYFRITQTGTAGNWWSIGELTAGLNNDDYSLTATTTARFGATGTQNIVKTHQDTWITTADLDNLKAAGMNFLRLPIGWNVFLNQDGTWKADPWSKIDWLINEASKRGMYTLIDLHTVPGGGCPWGSCGRIGPNPNGFWGSTTYQDWTVDIWKKIATRYKGNPAVAGYDLINEPLVDYGEDADDVTQKSAVYDRLYDAVRAIDPDHTIFLGAFFDVSKLAAPSTYGWTNVVYEYHPYDMPNSKNWESQDWLVTDQLAKVNSMLSNPGVPILYGEYSLYYNDDVWARFMAGLNAKNVSWSSWTYKVKGSASDGFGYWGMYYDNANPVPIINSDDAATFQSKLSKFATSNFTKNDRFIRTIAKYATSGLTTYNPVAIAHTGWTATASGGSNPGGAIDGANGSAWLSGAAQTNGQWLQIDMGSSQTVAMVTVQTPNGSRWDYPRSFRIEVSTNGSTWTTAATGTGYGWKTPVSIVPTSARYVRITQTGTAPQWWSVDEVTIYQSY